MWVPLNEKGAGTNPPPLVAERKAAVRRYPAALPPHFARALGEIGGERLIRFGPFGEEQNVPLLDPIRAVF